MFSWRRELNEGEIMNVDAEIYRPQNVVRVITATSLFDGHDASTNIMRRIYLCQT